MNRRFPRGIPILLLLVAMPLGIALPLEAQHFPSDEEILELIETRVEEGRATGIVVGVLEADGTRRIVSFGDAGPGALPLGPETIFEIGSITKVFTGILLADMAANGLLSLEDPLQDHLPEGVTAPSRPDQTIRLVDLSTHRSALPRLPANLRPADPTNPYVDYTEQMMWDFLSNHELRRDVGAESEYSNLAVGLLGHVLALRARTNYETLVTERVLVPLGMNASGIAMTPEMERHFAKGHDEAGNVVPYWDVGVLSGAGGIRSNVNDMLTFMEANVGEPTSDLERAMRVSHEPRAAMGGGGSQIGLNWIITPVGEDRIVWHNGGTAGFRTWAGFDPERGVAAVVLTNSAHGADDIGMHLVNAASPLAPAPAPPPEEVEVADEVLARYPGVYELAPTFSITVTHEDGGLFIQATGQPKFPVFAETETLYFLRVVEAKVEFVIEEGEVLALILHQGGASQRATRVR